MKIFLKVREEYEQALMRDEEVVAGIPAYVLFILFFFPSSPSFSSNLSGRITRSLLVGMLCIEIYIQGWSLELMK